MSNSLDVYPSTFDFDGRGIGSLLSLVERARARYSANGTDTGYISDEEPWACAVGAVWAADGLKLRDIDRDKYGNVHWCSAEKYMSRAAKEAMKLLDEATVELYPVSSEFNLKIVSYMGPLEYLNQSSLNFGEFVDRKDKVLRVYDLVIERLKTRQAEFIGDSAGIALETPDVPALELTIA